MKPRTRQGGYDDAGASRSSMFHVKPLSAWGAGTAPIRQCDVSPAGCWRLCRDRDVRTEIELLTAPRPQRPRPVPRERVENRCAGVSTNEHLRGGRASPSRVAQSGRPVGSPSRVAQSGRPVGSPSRVAQSGRPVARVSVSCLRSPEQSRSFPEGSGGLGITGLVGGRPIMSRLDSRETDASANRSVGCAEVEHTLRREGFRSQGARGRVPDGSVGCRGGRVACRRLPDIDGHSSRNVSCETESTRGGGPPRLGSSADKRVTAPASRNRRGNHTEAVPITRNASRTAAPAARCRCRCPGAGERGAGEPGSRGAGEPKCPQPESHRLSADPPNAGGKRDRPTSPPTGSRISASAGPRKSSSRFT